MTNEFTATASGKTGKTATGGATPFDQITALEQAEQKRVALELQAMEKEKAELELSLAEQATTAEKDTKESAKEELKKYREAELSPLVSKAETGAKSAVDAMNNAYQKNAPALKDRLLSKLTDSSLV